MSTPTRYDDDILAWSREQAEYLKAGRFDLLDLEHLADEVADVGKSEQRELASRMVVLLSHLLKWAYQPERRGASWEITIRNQRHAIQRRLIKTPSLKQDLGQADWWQDVWEDAMVQAIQETGLTTFPATCPWSTGQILAIDWLPS